MGALQLCLSLCRIFTVNGHARLSRAVLPLEAEFVVSSMSLKESGILYWALLRCSLTMPSVFQESSEAFLNLRTRILKSLSVSSAESKPSIPILLAAQRAECLLCINDLLSKAFLTSLFQNSTSDSLSDLSLALLSQSWFLNSSSVRNHLPCILIERIRTIRLKVCEWAESSTLLSDAVLPKASLVVRGSVASVFPSILSLIHLIEMCRFCANRSFSFDASLRSLFGEEMIRTVALSFSLSLPATAVTPRDFFSCLSMTQLRSLILEDSSVADRLTVSSYCFHLARVSVNALDQLRGTGKLPGALSMWLSKNVEDLLANCGFSSSNDDLVVEFSAVCSRLAHRSDDPSKSALRSEAHRRMNQGMSSHSLCFWSMLAFAHDAASDTNSSSQRSSETSSVEFIKDLQTAASRSVLSPIALQFSLSLHSLLSSKVASVLLMEKAAALLAHTASLKSPLATLSQRLALRFLTDSRFYQGAAKRTENESIKQSKISEVLLLSALFICRTVHQSHHSSTLPFLSRAIVHLVSD